MKNVAQQRQRLRAFVAESVVAAVSVAPAAFDDGRQDRSGPTAGLCRA
jgi:hypothetical protein